MQKNKEKIVLKFMRKIDMNLVVDRINEDIVICQDLATKMMFEIDKKTLNFSVQDGDVISLDNGKYILNKKLKEDRLKIISNKLKQAKSIQK